MVINRTIAFSITLGAALLVAVLALTAAAPPEIPSPPFSKSSPTPVPPSPFGRIVSGNVIAVSQTARTMTLGTYRLENNKAVLASQQTVSFTAETLFVRQVPSAGQQAPVQEVAITSSDIRAGDLVRIIPVPDATGEVPIAQRVIVLYLPAPPSTR